jgi:hypothetical protein
MKVNRNLAISENGFVFNPSSGDSFSVNELGLVIINLIKEGKTKTEIIETVLQDYNVEKSVIEKDFNEFVKILNNYQLAEIHD